MEHIIKFFKKNLLVNAENENKETVDEDDNLTFKTDFTPNKVRVNMTMKLNFREVILKYFL